MPLFLLLACSDYELQDKEPDPAPFDSGEPELGEPELVADPGWVDLGVVCGPENALVTLRNEGTADLVVSGIAVTGAWTATLPTLPAVLPPGVGIEVPVEGGPSDGSLIVSSDDPDTPELTISLAAAENEAPGLSFHEPADGSTLDVSAPTTFRAAVADDNTRFEALALTWASDVDGVLSTAPAGTDGVASMVWDPAARTSGPHRVTLTAVDACGATTTIELGVCQDEGYLADSLDLSTWHFEGSARYDATGGWVELTPPATYQSGTAFQTATTATSDNVVIDFTFFVSGGSGADGFSLTALDTTRMTGYVGASGGGIGYMGLPGWSIEVDTWYNSENNDPTPNDHVSVHVDGNAGTPLAWAELPEMEDGAWHTMTVSVVGTHVTVEIDGGTWIDQEVSGITSFPAYVGFTAGTGAATNYHLIDALEVTRYVCDG